MSEWMQNERMKVFGSALAVSVPAGWHVFHPVFPRNETVIPKIAIAIFVSRRPVCVCVFESSPIVLFRRAVFTKTMFPFRFRHTQAVLAIAFYLLCKRKNEMYAPSLESAEGIILCPMLRSISHTNFVANVPRYICININIICYLYFWHFGFMVHIRIYIFRHSALCMYTYTHTIQRTKGGAGAFRCLHSHEHHVEPYTRIIQQQQKRSNHRR